MPTVIEYEPRDETLAIDELVDLMLEKFPATGEPAVRPDIGGKLEYGDGFQRLTVYTEGEALRYEIRYTDLPNDDAPSKQIAHERSKRIVNALNPRYNGQASNLCFFFVEDGNVVLGITYR